MILNPTYNTCEICGELRSKRIHAKCSRILQQRSRDAKAQEEFKKVLTEARSYDDAEGVRVNRASRVRASSRRMGR